MLDQGDFNLTTPNNQTVFIDVNNVNNTDVWLWGLDADNIETNLWTKVDPNFRKQCYLITAQDIKKKYLHCAYKNRDAIQLKFADTFGNHLQGSFRVYYRTSANRS